MASTEETSAPRPASSSDAAASRRHRTCRSSNASSGGWWLVAGGTGRWTSIWLRSVEIVPEDLRPRRVAKLRHRLGLDLTDPLARDPVDLADLVERLGLTVGQTEAHRDDARLALGERVEDLVELLLQEREAHGVRRDDGLGVLDEVTELAVAVLAERGVQRDGLAAVLLDLHDLLGGHVELLGQLLRRGLAAQVLKRPALHACELVDQIEEEHAATRVPLGERHHQTEVRLQEVFLGPTAVTGDPLELAADLRLKRDPGVEALLGEQTGLDPLGEVDLLLGVEERDLADLLEVVLDRVGGGASGHDLLSRSVVVVGVGVHETGVLGLLLGRGLRRSRLLVVRL